MSTKVKGSYYRALKEAGVVFDLHYREYTTEQLKEAYERLPAELQAAHPIHLKGEGMASEPEQAQETRVQVEQMNEALRGVPEDVRMTTAPQHQPDIPLSDEPLDMIAGIRQNDGHEGPIRRDSMGNLWFQEEIRKKGYASARARRKLQYMDSGYKTVTNRLPDGSTETVEVAGEELTASTVKITLPSYQVGIYLDSRFPFKIHVYADARGFDREEVEDYYGGYDRVPTEVKRIYVENVLCYDMRTVIRAIEDEARRLRLL